MVGALSGGNKASGAVAHLEIDHWEIDRNIGRRHIAAADLSKRIIEKIPEIRVQVLNLCTWSRLVTSRADADIIRTAPDLVEYR